MKIRMRRNTRKHTASISFRAQGDREGVALKDAILAAAKEPVDAGLPAKIVEHLIDAGIDRADFDLAIVTPKARRRRPSSDAIASRRERQ